MSWTPTDEQVEKAARAGFEFDERVRVEFGHQEEPLSFDDLPGWGQQTHREKARAVLVAVGPMIAAQALRDAAEDMDAEYEARTAKVGSYGQMKIRAALVTGAGYARKRADQIEKEAGR